jgi:ParB-like chromosome segregation protein Spo0J
MGKDKMQVIYKSVDELIPYINNAKKHSDSQVKQIAASIKEFGFNAPVLIDGQNGIIAGHGRVAAAQLLELKHIPCISLAHLSDLQKKAYILADNRLSELGGGWDFDILSIELESLKSYGMQIDITGFDEESLPTDTDLNSFFEESNAAAKEKNKICPHCGKNIYEERVDE